MGRPGDYGNQQGYQGQAGSSGYGPAVPPQFQQDAPPRQDGTRGYAQQGTWQQPQFQPAAQQAPYQQRQYQPGYAQPPQYAPPGQQQWQQPAPAPRKKRRVFLWVFLAIQALFIIWIIAGVASHPAGPTAAQQAAQQCANGGWKVLFQSQADCQQHYAHALNEATNVGKGLGVAVIVVVWVVIDFFLGLGYGIYRLASRR